MIDAAQYATPDKIFPAITLLLLAYVNRFSALSAKTREFKDKKGMSSSQTALLHKRVHLVKHMLVLGMAGVLAALMSFVLIAMGASYGVTMVVTLLASLLVSGSLITAIREVAISTDALDDEIEEGSAPGQAEGGGARAHMGSEGDDVDSSSSSSSVR